MFRLNLRALLLLPILLVLTVVSFAEEEKSTNREEVVPKKKVQTTFVPNADGEKFFVEFELPKTAKINRRAVIAKYLFKDEAGQAFDVFLFVVKAKQEQSLEKETDLELAYRVAEEYPNIRSPFERKKLLARKFEPIALKDYRSKVLVSKARSEAISIVERTPRWAIIAYVQNYEMRYRKRILIRKEGRVTGSLLLSPEDYVMSYLPKFEARWENPKLPSEDDSKQDVEDEKKEATK